MAWTSFAHLPTSEDEYWYILSHLKNNMSIKEVDKLIATYKGKETVSYHYRSSLMKIGLFAVINKRVILNYDANKLYTHKGLLSGILSRSVAENKDFEIEEVAKAINLANSYDLKKIVYLLIHKNPKLSYTYTYTYNSLIRGIRTIVFLLEYIDTKSVNQRKIYQEAKYLQDSYMNVAKGFGVKVSLELVENELKKYENNSLSIVKLLDKILDDYENRFKVELLMLPRWATNSRVYKIGQDMYTHIRLKRDLINRS